MSEPTQQKSPETTLSPKNRRLVLLFDGTWNERSSQTNVARMFEAIDDYKPKNYDAETYEGENPVQLVKYFSGVGTNVVGHFAGGAIGWGLSDIIKEAYCWLSNNYRDGDEIFVFGFSRGAYSARSLVSLVHRCGGVLKNIDKKEIEVHDDILKDAFAMYQSYVVTTDEQGKTKDDLKLNKAFDRRWNHFCTNYRVPRSSDRIQGPVKVKMLGVWDTVGALGIPGSLFTNPFLKRILYPFSKLANVVDYFVKFSRKHYAFHDQNLPCIVDHAYHALALDEFREDFKPTLWENRHRANIEVKQVWFIGSHANVGGGAAPENNDDPDDLWQYSYIWMQANASKLGLRFYFKHTPGERIQWANQNKRYVSYTTPEDSFINTGIPVTVPYFKKMRMHLMKFNIIQYSWFHTVEAGIRPANGSNGAKLHWSVKERIQQDADRHDCYNPESLRISRDGKSIKFQYKTKGEPEAQFNPGEWIEWPIEDETGSENQKYNPCILPVVQECSCMKLPEKQLVPHSWTDLLKYILMI